jgi:hypothetical protein
MSSAVDPQHWCARLSRSMSIHYLPVQAFLPLVTALYHSIRHPSQRQYPAWSAGTRPRTHLDRVYSFVFDSSTRYLVPSFLLSISSFLAIIKSSALRSTYICPMANSTATTVASLQFVAFLLDCIIVQILYRLVDDGISEADDWTIHLQDGTSNHMLVGLTLIVCFYHTLSITPHMLTGAGFIFGHTCRRHHHIPCHARASPVDALLSSRISPWSFAFIVDDTLYDIMFPQIGTSTFLSSCSGCH